MNLKECSDEEIVRHARSAAANDAAVDLSDHLAVLYERHWEAVRIWCQRVCGDADRAEDAAQEVFLRMQQKLTSFKGDSRFTTWLYSLTRRTTINYLKRPRHRQEDRGNDVLDHQVDPTTLQLDRIARQQLLAKVIDAINTELEDLPRQVVYLYYGVGMPLGAISEHLGLTNKSGAKAYLVSAQRTLGTTLSQLRAELERLQ